MCGAIHSMEIVNTGRTMATVHWPEVGGPKLGQNPTDHEGEKGK